MVIGEVVIALMSHFSRASPCKSFRLSNKNSNKNREDKLDKDKR